MGKFKLTEAQQKFVDVESGNVLVSASAGSGKTSTMIEKLANLIMCGTDIRNLLVVTYTNASASEMKIKLYKKLLECLTDVDDEKKDFLSEQIDFLNNADIGTVHSICKKILLNYFYIADIDPTFSIVSGKEQGYIFNTALDNVFDRLIAENNADFYAIYSLYSNKRNTKEIKAIIKKVYNFCLSKVDYIEWKNAVLNEFLVGDIDANPSARLILDYYKSEIMSFENAFRELLVADEKLFIKYSDYVNSFLNIISLIASQTSYKKMCKILPAIELMKKPNEKGKDIDDKLYSEQLKSVRDDFKKVFDKMKLAFVDYSVSEMENARRVVELFFWLNEEVGSEYEKLKKQKNVLDFSDLEHYTLKVLSNDKICGELKQKYKYIFVDEYQDINQVQEKIINLLSDNNVNMIGDLKQSIYHFRLSSPEIFIDKFNRFSAGDGGQVINLNYNFRSRPNILDFANFVFDVLMTTKTIGIDYKENSRLTWPNGEMSTDVDIDILNCEDEKRDESELIAQRVAELVTEGYNYSDIAILFRSRDMVVPLVEKLRNYNIPCNASYKTKLFNNNEILVLTSFLRVVNNSCDDLAMATVLKSLFCGLQDSELANIRFEHRNGTYCDAVKCYLENHNDLVTEKIKGLMELINECRFHLGTMPIVELLRNVMIRYGVVEHYMAFVDGETRVSNINYFLGLISNEEYKYNLKKCLDYLDDLRSDDVEVEVAGGSNCVKIMTIHASKGLEFPAVIVGGFGKNFNLRSDVNSLIINENLGLGVKVLDLEGRTKREGLVEKACKIQNKIDDLNEEIRLLYVALTRAKFRLCIVGQTSVKLLKKKCNASIYSSRNYFEYLIKAFGKQNANRLNDGSITIGLGESECRVNIISPETLAKNEVEKAPIILKQDTEFKEIMDKYYNYIYPTMNTNIAVKNTVSSILKEEVDYENAVENLKNVGTMQTSESEEAMKLGTAYHTTMQNLNYSENEAKIEGIIDNIKTSDLPYDKVDKKKIFSAINTIRNLFKDGCSLKKEAQFTMKLNYGEIHSGAENVDVIVQGVIDLVIENPSETIVVDFKTNKNRNEKFYKDTYSLQLDMYAKAYAKAFGANNIKKYLYSFELDKLIEI